MTASSGFLHQVILVFLPPVQNTSTSRAAFLLDSAFITFAGQAATAAEIKVFSKCLRRRLPRILRVKIKSLCVRLQSSECHLFFIPGLLWGSTPGGRGVGAGGLGAACTLGQIQTSSTSNFEDLKKRFAWCRAADEDRHFN